MYAKVQNKIPPHTDMNMVIRIGSSQKSNKTRHKQSRHRNAMTA